MIQILGMKKLLIAVPALNEEQSLPRVIQQLKLSFPDAGILVINDGSSDSTAQIAIHEEVLLVSHPFNLGVGAAMKTAFKYAKNHGFEYVIQFDGDGQHSHEFVLNLLEELHSVDVVIGGRFEESDSYEMEFSRRLAIRVLSLILRVGTHRKIGDPTSGNRGAGVRAIEIFSEKYPTEYLADTVGSLIIAAKAGLVIKEVPVKMKLRQGGQASQTYISSVKHFIRIVLISLSMLLSKEAGTRKAIK